MNRVPTCTKSPSSPWSPLCGKAGTIVGKEDTLVPLGLVGQARITMAPVLPDRSRGAGGS